MRILWFNLACDRDEAPLAFTETWINAVASHVEAIDVVTMRKGRSEPAANVTIRSLGQERGYSEPRRALRFYRILGALLAAHRYDVCFSHMNPLFSVMAWPLLQWQRVPIVTWYAHASRTLKLRMAHLCSARMVASIAAAYPHRKDKLTVVGQGIDSDLFQPCGGPDPEQVTVVSCVGRLSPVKRIELLIQALALVKRDGGPDFILRIVGDPASAQDHDYVRNLRQQVADEGMEKQVQFLPSLAREKLPAFYSASTVLVNQTPTGSFDKVPLEGMSCGCPTIVMNDGFADTLGLYTKELLVREGDERDLANTVSRIVEWSPEKRKEVGLYLRQQVIQTHSLTHIAQRIVEVLGEVSDGPSSGKGSVH